MKYPYIIILLIISQSLLAQTTTLYQYDNLNRLIQTEYPDGTIETFTYDEVGNRLSCIITGTATVDLYFVAQSLASSTLSAGASSDLSFTLGNNGNAAAAAQKTYFYLSTDTEYDAGDSEVGCQYVSGIAAMSNAPYTTTVQIPSTTTGTYYLLLVADGEEQVAESDEDNNVAYIPITISDDAQANLVVQNASISPTTVAVGGSSSIDFDIANIGTADAAATTFKVYLSDDLTWDGNDSDLMTATQSIPMLTANSSQAFSGTLSIPANTMGGAYYLLFYADAQQTQTESDEGDNIVPVAITITDDGAAAPMAGFTADLTDICVGQSIMFQDASTNQPTAWAWSFEGGEPATSNAANPSVTYHQAGTYSVSLTVTNENGNNNTTAVAYITVGEGGNTETTEGAWLWADQFDEASSSDIQIADIYTTTNNQTYAIGHFKGTVTIGGQNITSNDSSHENFYIAKFDEQGQLIWLQQHGTVDRSERYYANIIVDEEGYIYLTGQLQTRITIGGRTIEPSEGLGGVFFAKLDPTGTSTAASDGGWLIYGESLSGEIFSETGIALEIYQNNLLVVGNFDGTVQFGSIVLTSASQSDNYLISIDKLTGGFNWVRRFGGTDFDWVRGLTISATGKAYVTGEYHVGMNFEGGNTNLLSETSGETNAYLVEYDALTGNFGWAKSVSNTLDVLPTSLTTDDSGIYLAGKYKFEPIYFAGTTLTNSGGYNIFVLKYDNDGNEIWGKGYTANQAYDMTNQGNQIYLTGSYQNMISFGDLSLTPTGTAYNLFILSLNDTGQEIWVESVESTGNFFGLTLDLETTGDILIGGGAPSGTTFGDIDVNGAGRMFIAKYHPSQASNISCNLPAITITPNGSTTLCPNQNVELTAPSGYNYQWSTGESTQRITVTQAADYTVTITDCSGCTAVSDPVQVSVGGEAEPLNFYTSNENCYNQDGVLGYLMPNRTQDIQVSWNGGSQTFQANQNVELTDLSAGTYYTTMTDYLGCVYEDVVMINRTGDVPNLAFNNITDELTLTLSNQSTNAANYVWYLGDGSTSTDVHPIHTYAEYGTYNVCLSANNDCNNNVICQSIVVEDPALCLFVTNTNDSGPGSLRAAIDCANLNSGADTIRFDVANINPFIISLLSELPPLENDGTVIIGDLTTGPQFRFSNTNKVELDGSQLFNTESGLNITGDDIEIYGLHIHSFPAHGFFLNSANNTIIGGTTSNQDNIIANNQGDGLHSTMNANNNRFYQNSIFCNNEKGINHDQNNKPSPVMSSITDSTITGTATAGDRIEVFEHDETCMGCQGRTFLGATTADINGDWTLVSAFTAGQNLTATATDTNNTSEFSICARLETSTSSEGLKNCLQIRFYRKNND